MGLRGLGRFLLVKLYLTYVYYSFMSFALRMVMANLPFLINSLVFIHSRHPRG